MSDYRFARIIELESAVKEVGLSISVVGGGGGNTGMADVLIEFGGDGVIGFTIATSETERPFTLFPFGNVMNLEEVRKFLAGFKMGEDLHA